MNTTLFAIGAVLSSAAPLLLLALRDPKRLRSLRRRTLATARGRRGLGGAAVLPGLILAGAGQWPAFLLWLGTLLSGGWLLVQLLALAQRPPPAHD